MTPKNAMLIGAVTSLITLAGLSAALESAPRWIWYPENAVSEARDADRFFRVRFDLAENPERADLWVVVDDAGEFWVNDERLGEPAERRGGGVRFPVAHLLHAGTNVLAAKVHNATNVAGLIARLTIALPTAPQRSVVTNADWKAGREPAAGWTGLGFDDSAWLQAREIGDAWAAPWSDYAAYDTTALVTDAERAARTAALEQMLELPEGLDRESYAHAEIAHRDGSVAVIIDGKPRPAVFYRATIDPFSEHGRRQINLFAAAGVHLFAPYFRADKCWNGPDDYDFSTVDTGLRAYLSADPDAYLLPIIRLIPPPWWMDAHPTEWVHYAKTDAFDSSDEARNVKRASLASDVWLADTSRFWRALIRHVEQQPWGKRVIGWQPGYGIYAEWHYFGGWTGQMPDTGEAMTRRFRQWARARYGTQAALRTAWADPGAAFEGVAVPGVAPRERGQLLSFRDPEHERWVIDYYRCQQEITADCIETLGRAAKEESGGRCLHGAYYGYFFNVIPQAQAGHLDLERLLASDAIDYFVAPFSYEFRLMGDDGRLRAGARAYALAGKVHIIEADIRTHLHSRNEYGRAQNLTESLAAIRREFSTALTEGAGFWFVDFGPDSRGGWFDAPEIIAEIKRLVDLAREAIGRPRRPTAEIALVIDPKSGYYLSDAEGTRTAHRLIENVATELHHTGAPFDLVFLSQLGRADLERYKLLVFLNTFAMDDSQAAALAQLREAGSHAMLWLWAPALLSPDGVDVAQAARVTGFDLELLRRRLLGRIRVTATDCPLTAAIPKQPVVSLTPARAVELEDTRRAANWFNPRDQQTMNKWFRAYEVREEDRGICWTFDTDYHWNDIHARVPIDPCDGLAISLRPRGRWDRLEFRLVIKDADGAEFMTPKEPFDGDAWTTRQYALQEFTNADWSKQKPERPAWPLTGIKLVFYGTAGAGRFDVGIRQFARLFGETSQEERHLFGDNAPFGPVLVAKDGEPVGVADGTDLCLLAVKDHGRNVFLGAPFAPRELLAALAEAAGVHRYDTDPGDVVRADSRYLVIHTKHGGPRHIHLPHHADVTDAQTGDPVGTGTTFDTVLPPNSTSIWSK